MRRPRNHHPRAVKQLAVRIGWRLNNKTRTHETIRAVLECLADVVRHEAEAGRPVVLKGFGTFRPYRTKARTMRTRHGVSEVPSRVVVKFRAHKALRLEAR